MSPDQVLDRFKPLRRTRKGWMGRCRGHQDRQASLSIAIGDDGRVLLNCFAGCKAAAIVAGAGLRLRDLFPDDHAPPMSRRPRALSPLDEARREVLDEARRQLRRLDLEAYADADIVRACHRTVREARAVATRLGDHDHSWALLALAADLERDYFSLESALDSRS